MAKNRMSFIVDLARSRGSGKVGTWEVAKESLLGYGN